MVRAWIDSLPGAVFGLDGDDVIAKVKLGNQFLKGIMFAAEIAG